jgi:DNA-binding HxlR family transcriptional regulator
MSSELSTATWADAGSATLPLFVEPNEIFDDVQDVIGRKWHLRIVYQLLENGPLGFSSLKSELVGVSSKMLSESLTRLEDDGVLDREIVSEQPVRVEYSLTERGRALEPVVSAVIAWGSEYGTGGE